MRIGTIMGAIAGILLTAGAAAQDREQAVCEDNPTQWYYTGETHKLVCEYRQTILDYDPDLTRGTRGNHRDTHDVALEFLAGKTLQEAVDIEEQLARWTQQYETQFGEGDMLHAAAITTAHEGMEEERLLKRYREGKWRLGAVQAAVHLKSENTYRQLVLEELERAQQAGARGRIATSAALAALPERQRLTEDEAVREERKTWVMKLEERVKEQPETVTGGMFEYYAGKLHKTGW